VEPRKSWKDRLPGILRSKKGYVVLAALPGVAVLFTSHEVVTRYFPDKACIACHEMKDPVKRWMDSGTAKNHPSCVSCHYEPGMEGIIATNKFAVKAFFKHWERDPKECLRPPAEPLFLDENQEPGYFSLVPNHRCFVCKSAKNHREMDQRMIHSKLVADISSKPCRDCHNHEMRKGQKFYEKVIPKEKDKDKTAEMPIGAKKG
jgi:hypothetical protein